MFFSYEFSDSFYYVGKNLRILMTLVNSSTIDSLMSLIAGIAFSVDVNIP